MKNLLIYILLIATVGQLQSQSLVSPPDMVISCSYPVDLSQGPLAVVDHPIFGGVDIGIPSGDSIITIDQLCSSYCEVVPGSSYRSTLDVFEQACGFYEQRYDGHFDSLHVLNWGSNGLAIGLDSVSVRVLVVERKFPKPLYYVQRIFSGFNGNDILRDTQHIFQMRCGFFDVNVKDRFDTMDCVDLAPLDPEVYIFTELMRDSIIYPDAILGEECLICRDLLVIEYDDEIVFGDATPYLQLKRTWTIIDWTVYDPLDPNSTGRWEYCQILHAFFDEGNLFGQVYYDEDGDCVFDSTETPLRNWVVQAVVGRDTFTTISSNDGRYVLPVYFGSGEIRAFPPNPYWSTCQEAWSISLDVNNVQDTINIGASPDSLCAVPLVTVVVPNLEYCDTNRVIIEVLNQGTEATAAGSVDFTMPSFLEIIRSSRSFSPIGAGTYNLDVGVIGPGEAIITELEVIMDCDSTAVDDVICFRGEFTPFDSCAIQALKGPVLEAELFCQDDSIIAIIRNIGGDMQESQNYWVVEDDLILFFEPVELDSLEEKRRSVAANGHTYHLVCEQKEYVEVRPFASAGLVNCNRTDEFPGYLNNTVVGAPFFNVDYTCATVGQNTQSVAKTAEPEGRGPDHWINKDEVIDYTISFRNDALDTVKNVYIDDVMSKNVDLESFQLLSASHDVELKFLITDTADFYGFEARWMDIDLGPRDWGYLTYRVKLKEDVMAGDSVTNETIIQLGHRPPQSTDLVFHTIEKDSIVSTDAPISSIPNWEVFPNPFSRALCIKFTEVRPLQELKLINLQGQMVETININAAVEQYSWNVSTEVPPGVYLMEVVFEHGVVSSKRVVKVE